MDKLDEVNDDSEACMKYVERKMLAWYTKYLPKNDGAAAAVEASAAPPPRTPDSTDAAARPMGQAPPQTWHGPFL
jgi:hypothetical protein